LKTPSDRRPGWEAIVLGYTSKSKVRPLHQVYVSVTILYLALSSELGLLQLLLSPLVDGAHLLLHRGDGLVHGAHASLNSS